MAKHNTHEVGGKEYDIFISYRRDDGAQYARILQLELEKRGFKVFLDYEELVDGIFGDEIKNAIKSAPTFIMVLTPKYLERSMMEDSWVREEITLALANGSHFVPVNPDSLFNGIPDETPEDIKKIVSTHQHSEINFGQLLGESVDKMVANRIEFHPRSGKKWTIIVIAILALLAAGVFFTVRLINNRAINELMVEKAPGGQYLNWDPNISLKQIRTVHQIMDKMLPVDGGTFVMGPSMNPDGSYREDVDLITEIPPHEMSVLSFFLGKYEVSIGEWYGIMGGKYDKQMADYPISGVSYEDCLGFCQTLNDLCGLSFRLPKEEEWEFAAKGGNHHETTRFIGSDNPDDVSWYNTPRTGNHAHLRNDPHGGLRCNSLDLFDMGGNVYEWCDTPFRLYKDIVSGTDTPEIIDPYAKVIRGGSFASELYEITATHREPMNAGQRDNTIGFRLAL